MLSFGARPEAAYPKIISVLLNSLMSVTGEQLTLPETFANVKDGLQSVAQAFRAGGLIFLMPDCEEYMSVRHDIYRALHLETQLDKNIASRISDTRLLDYAILPKGCETYALSDGLYPSFIIKSKNQSIIFMPMCDDRTFLTMKNLVFPFISEAYGLKCGNFLDYETDYAAVIFKNSVAPKGLKVAVSNTPVIKYLKQHGICTSVINDYMEIVPYFQESSVSDFREYIQMTAVGASEFLEMPLGGAAIEAPADNTNQGNHLVHLAVVNEETATIKTISSIDDESYDDFMHTVATEFLLMLAHLADETAPETTETAIRKITPTPVIGRWKPLLYLLLVAAACALSYFTVEQAQTGVFWFNLF